LDRTLTPFWELSCVELHSRFKYAMNISRYSYFSLEFQDENVPQGIKMFLHVGDV
jgi:hypothetical protein